jgi:hypothetical protein
MWVGLRWLTVYDCSRSHITQTHNRGSGCAIDGYLVTDARTLGDAFPISDGSLVDFNVLAIAAKQRTRGSKNRSVL